MFALVDCNNFYVSCERVFNPRLWNKPCVVLSNNDGCIISRSNEVKELGIPMGAPCFKWKPYLEKHRVRIFSSNYALYADLSQRVMDILSLYSPYSEIYSIDEAFLFFKDFLPKDLLEYGTEVRSTVFQWTGIPISIGFGKSKTLAKVANKIAKKQDGVFYLQENKCDEILSSINVLDIWGIGSKNAKLLMTNGIRNALELKNAKDSWIRKHLSIVGLRLVNELRGISCLPIEEVIPAKKAIGCSRSFNKPTSNKQFLKEALACYLSRACEKLRKQDSLAYRVHVYIKTNRFKEGTPYYSNAASIKLLFPTSDTCLLLKEANQCLDKIYLPDLLYKKLGVLLTDLVPKEHKQLPLFKTQEFQEENSALMSTIDLINNRWGSETIGLGAVGNKDWAMKRQMMSKRFTTNWDELLKVKV